MSRSSSPSRLVPLIVTALLLASSLASAAPRHPVQVSGVLNLNTASVVELRRLPGVGEKKAARIVERRTQQKFQTTDQLMKVKGFGRLTYRKLKPYLAVAGATTLKREAVTGTAPASQKP